MITLVVETIARRDCPIWQVLKRFDCPIWQVLMRMDDVSTWRLPSAYDYEQQLRRSFEHHQIERRITPNVFFKVSASTRLPSARFQPRPK